tara:strand:+ start:811 stop:1158 length:348 start_codon:yes stop_codon:yes gene_type:complete
MTRARKSLRINYLSQGMESPAKIDLLLSVTKISRSELIAGLKDYYCRGFSKVKAASLNGVASQNLSAPIAKLDEVAEAFEKYIELKANELSGSKLTPEQQTQAKQHKNFNKEYLE